MTLLDYRNIEKVPGRCGGQAVIANSRIRVATILIWHRQGISVEEIHSYYPHLRISDIYDALAYAYDHLDEIEADIAAEEAVVRRLWPDADLSDTE
jgi:uncharacterized protein (DUF433 family)